MIMGGRMGVGGVEGEVRGCDGVVRGKKPGKFHRRKKIGFKGQEILAAIR